MAGPAINIETLKTLVEKRDKILKRFLFYEPPPSASDIKIKVVSKNAYTIYPFFAVDKTYLYFPAIPGVEGMILGKFKSPKHADYFVRLLNPETYNLYETIGGDSSDVYKFILNRAFLTTSFIFDKNKDNPDSGSAVTKLYPEDRWDNFLTSFIKDLNFLVQYYAVVLKQDPGRYVGTFIENFIDLEAVEKLAASSSNNNRKAPFMMFPIPTQNVSVISQETADGINAFYLKSSSRNKVLPAEEIYVGIRHYQTMSKLYGLFMKADGYNINKMAPSQSIAVGQLFKNIKFLLKDFKGTDPLVIHMINNFDKIEANLVRLSRYHINVAGTKQRANSGVGMNISDYFGWDVISQIFDPDARSNPKIRIKIPTAYVRFMLNRSKSMKGVIMKLPQQKVKQFLILMYYPILTVYMYFFQMSGADSEENFMYEKYSRYMADWFEKTNSGRGGFEFVSDKTNFYVRAERLIKNFK